ncbi:tetratricopeptide repeat protein, partial [Pasteurella multocida subsp. multocida str. Anand1_cattle]
ELAQSLSLEEKTQQERQKGLLVSALKVAPNCVRASNFTWSTFNPRKRYQQAVMTLEMSLNKR